MRTSIGVTRNSFCRALCFALLVAAPLAAGPKGEVPFRASFDTQFQADATGFPILTISVQGQGQALHMGRTTTSTDNQVVNLLTGVATATYTAIAANGDTVVFEFLLDTVFSGTGAAFTGTYEITGGTGRFSGATGHGRLVGSAEFTEGTSGVGGFTLDGTISSPGSR